jgi:IclR family transcriptional regulator, KDG regulon repressor
MSKEVIKTAKRLFEILEYFDEVQRPLSLKDVALQFSYPVSSASAVLKSMVVLGYIDFDRYSRTYMPTMRIVQLGHWVQSALFGERGISALVNHLNKETEETVSIATQSDLYMQYIHVQPSPRTIQFSIKPGTIRPLARSGLGWMLLSARSDETIEKLVRRINFEEEDRKKKVDLKELMQKLRKIRKDGYVISLHTVTAGAGVIGMLLPERRHGRILAIGVGGPVERLVSKRTQILRSLREGIDKFVTREDRASATKARN